MRLISELSREELEQIVQSVQDLLYLDTGQSGDFYNPEKDWSGADVCESIAATLREFGLVPEVATPAN
ncbi:MAG: hypothetical protein WD030_07615 [Pirellulales bacterium]